MADGIINKIRSLRTYELFSFYMFNVGLFQVIQFTAYHMTLNECFCWCLWNATFKRLERIDNCLANGRAAIGNA